MIEADILKGLNKKQLEAVTHFTGPMVIIAGAGSGKTRALTHRVAYLIQKHGIAPWNILAVTFTNKAASEMKTRIKNLIGIDDKQTGFSAEPTVGTFHSICVRILRKHIHLLDYDSNFTIYDANDQQVLMKRVMEELHIDSKKINPKALLSHVSNAKNELIDYEEYSAMASNYFTERVAEVFKPYQDALKKNNALDFDDLIMKTVELFLKHPEILDEYQEKWKFICVDEYQDTNQSQYKLINLLAEKYRNICVIGDSDQSIYSWRGADIRNILDFEKDYKDTKTVKLEQNYRSTQVILDAAHQIIIKNKKRREKKLWTDREDSENIKVIATNSERHEGETIAESIRDACSGYEAPPYNEFVVLYRTNAQSRVIEEIFLRYGIPYKIIGGIKFYARKEIKDIIAYLRIIQNPHDTVSLLRIVNTPTRKIGTKTIDVIQTYANLHGFSIYEAMQYAKDIDNLNDGKVLGIQKFLNIIEQLQDINTKYPASEIIKQVFELTGYQDFVQDGSVEGEARYENILELMSVSAKYDELEPKTSLAIFLEEIALIADIDKMDDKENSVTLMTVHSAKGLEFNTVFIAGLEEGIFPHSRSMLEPEQLEEERRLMYVAVTRAKDDLYLLYARNRMLYGEAQYNPPSQFINDIADELIVRIGEKRPSQMRSFGGHSGMGNKPIPFENQSRAKAGPSRDLSDGDKVSHATFGEGVIVNIQGDVATVAFKKPSVGIKKLALSIAPLDKI